MDADVFQEIENLDTLIGIEELWLGKNKLTEIKVKIRMVQSLWVFH